jgi:signal transduction histidine kinase
LALFDNNSTMTSASSQPENDLKNLLYISPLRVFIIAIAGIFLAEIIAMIIVYMLLPLPIYQQALLNAGIIILIVFPVLYFFSYRPLLLSIAKSAELFELSQDQIRKLTTLRDIDIPIASSLELHPTVDIVIDQTIKHLDVDAVAIGLYQQNTSVFNYIGSAGFQVPPSTSLQPYSRESLSDKVVAKQAIVHIADLKSVPEADMAMFAHQQEFVTYIGVPLIVKGQVKGVFEIYHRTKLSPTSDWMSFLQTIATQTALAIDNSILFEALQRSNEELRIAIEELKQLDKKKNDFVSTVSHELRTPLTSLQSCIENLLSGMYGLLSEKQRSRLEIALISAREESRLITNLLDLALIQHSKSTLDLGECDICKIIHDILVVFQYDAKQKNILLKEELPIDEKVEVRADAAKIKQVITNLISNALKFTPEAGTIIVQLHSTNKQVKIQVRDTGVGIPETEFQKIFNRFYQVDSSLTRNVGGAGIGLHIAKEYVEMHGGNIWVESSQIGKGSVFSFILPMIPFNRSK